MEGKLFLRSCLVFLFLSTGNIEKGKGNMKNEIPRSFSNRCSVVRDSSYCMNDPSLLFLLESAEQRIYRFSKNPLVNSHITEGISKNKSLEKEHSSFSGAKNTESKIRHSKHEDLKRGVKEMANQFHIHQKNQSSVLRKPLLHACKTLFLNCHFDDKQEECEYTFERKVETWNIADQLSFTKMKTCLKDCDIPESTKITPVSGLCPTGSIPFQTFSSTQPPVINGFYNDPPWLHRVADNYALLKNDCDPSTEEQQATSAIGKTDNTLMDLPTSHNVLLSGSSATLLANTLEGSFAVYAPSSSSSSELGSYSSSVLFSSSEGCQETYSIEPTPAMDTSTRSEPSYSSAVGVSGVNTISGGQFSASYDAYAPSVLSEPYFSASNSPGIIYPSLCSFEGSTESSDVFSLYGFVDISHDTIEY